MGFLRWLKSLFGPKDPRALGPGERLGEWLEAKVAQPPPREGIDDSINENLEHDMGDESAPPSVDTSEP